jgi:hypothetical protein
MKVNNVTEATEYMVFEKWDWNDNTVKKLGNGGITHVIPYLNVKTHIFLGGH